jgi:CelD/BcsL family acetyltransferase involved in cellulose biosynthesis
MRDRIEWVQDPAAFEALAGEWEPLAARTRYPFMRHPWLSAWWQSFGRSGRLLVCTARRDGRLVGALPLWRRRGVASSLANAHTPVFVPLAADRAALQLMVDATLAAGFPSLVVGPLPADDGAVPLLLEASRAAGRNTWLAQAHASPVVEVAGSADEYRDRLPRDLRRELARLRRKLEREHEADFVTLAAAAPDTPTQLEQGLELERDGWKGRRRTAILSSPDTASFYRDVSGRLASDGTLRLSTLVVDGRPVAFDLGILSDGALWLPKGAYDERYGRYAPGLLLLLDEIDRAHELSLDRVELLGDAERYKLKFASRTRSHVVVHSHALATIPLARSSYARWGRPVARTIYRRAIRRRRR